ncbi:MAG: nucleotidyl transferase AbiEii/AbiGii toxin family protein [Arcobacter sp.]|uniref:nucleotidyl transferase AbiEii/AbiGii toxin family protein n=1 Tax=Arcobacter sp. TaxID=1872629 RepID=UPI003C741F0D
MNGYLNNFEQQINTLNSVYYELLAPIEKQSSLKNWWVFGGGTALAMFHFNHRKSFDIDIFITESQLFDFLNPKWYIDETKIFDNNEYRFDGMTHHIQLKTKDDIKVDFLLNEAIINKPIKDTKLNIDYELFYESVEDIIAKKIKYRKQDNLTRDIFDIAISISFDESIIENLIYSRFITFDDLEVLNTSLNKLDEKKYILELEKIEPQTKEFEKIALDGKNIIQKNINTLLYKQEI